MDTGSMFDSILDVLEGNDELLVTTTAVEKPAANVLALPPKRGGRKPAKKKTPPTPRHVNFDPQLNILEPQNQLQFKTVKIFEETDIFTEPISTTNTMEGYISNVRFHEAELIKQVVPDVHVVQYRCNFGRVKYEGYTEPVKIKNTNRGRKKKIKPKKARKKQGDGSHFNSQLTFEVPTRTVAPLDDGTIPYRTKVFKFKVFRTGVIQLPGVIQGNIGDVIECIQVIVDVLNRELHSGITDSADSSQMIYLTPVMTNYKFRTKLPAGRIFNLTKFMRILSEAQLCQEGAEHPPIFMIKYTRSNTKLAIEFITPIRRQPKKMTRVNIFMRGKINLLGACDTDASRAICKFLHEIICQNIDAIIVQEEIIEPLWEENIAQYDDDEYLVILQQFSNRIMPSQITSEDCQHIINYATGLDI